MSSIDEPEDEARYEDECECGRERRFCRTFNDEDAPYGDDA
jgi:hypothetical protein